MTDFAPFTMRTELAVPAAWAAWAGAVLSGQTPAPPAAPPFAAVREALSGHGLLPLLYHHLHDTAAWSALPANLCDALTQGFQTNAARSFLLECELGRIAAVSPGLGLLKGAALGYTLYPNAALRPVSDLDLLLEPARVAAVQAQLEGLGYRGIGLAAHARLGGLVRRFRAELPFIRRAPGLGHLLVELHWSLAELPHYVELIPAAALLQGAQPCPALDGFVVPRPAVLLACAAGHLALHHSRDLRLIWLVDLDRLARWPVVRWDDVLPLAEKWKLGLALHTGLRAAQRWLGTPLDEAVMAELSRLAQDPVAVRSLGLGDEAPDRAWQRSRAALAALPPRSAVRYAGWLAARAALRPLERRLIAQTQRAAKDGRP